MKEMEGEHLPASSVSMSLKEKGDQATKLLPIFSHFLSCCVFSFDSEAEGRCNETFILQIYMYSEQQKGQRLQRKQRRRNGGGERNLVIYPLFFLLFSTQGNEGEFCYDSSKSACFVHCCLSCNHFFWIQIQEGSERNTEVDMKAAVKVAEIHGQLQ